MKEKRICVDDRRQRLTVTELELPLFDVDGDFIKEDRRTAPDRRLNNIFVEEVGCITYISEVIKKEKD